MKIISSFIMSCFILIFLNSCSSETVSEKESLGEEKVSSDTSTLPDTSSLPIETLSSLSSSLDETSGLAKIDDKIYTHNDSGSLAELYEINPISGDILRTITVENSQNIDWEGLATDDTHLYVADIGNNLGNRKDLKIYKILKDDIIQNDVVTCEVISFSYEDQTLFDYESYTTPYDAEAIVAYKGELYIFTKNWDNYTTRIYRFPSTSGEHIASFVSEKEFKVMITDADIDLINNRVALIGYESHIYAKSPKNNVIILSDFIENDFLSGNIVEYDTQSKVTKQGFN